MMSVAERLAQVRERLEKAVNRVSRPMDSVKLVGASKVQTTETLREAYDAGLRTFGENRVQEGKAKVPEMPEDCEWHMIGALQTNKAKDVVKLFSWVHSVDSERLALELEKRCASAGRRMNVLLEVNVGGEVSKHGVRPDSVEPLLEVVRGCSHLDLKGLMTVAPFDEDLERVRPFFAELRDLRQELAKKSGLELPELSMGMSHDFEVAVEEGATMVRVGSSIFGARPQR